MGAVLASYDMLRYLCEYSPWHWHVSCSLERAGPVPISFLTLNVAHLDNVE